MKLPDIEPCPWCGYQATLKGSIINGQLFVECDNTKCLASGPLKSSPRAAVKAWNKRIYREDKCV
jgi:hypothetical protein